MNLNTVLETTTRKKNNYKLFDKFAYITRAERFKALPYEGLQVDRKGLVCFQIAEQQQLKMLEIDKAKLKRELSDFNGDLPIKRGMLDSVRQIQPNRYRINK